MLLEAGLLPRSGDESLLAFHDSPGIAATQAPWLCAHQASRAAPTSLLRGPSSLTLIQSSHFRLELTSFLHKHQTFDIYHKRSELFVWQLNILWGYAEGLVFMFVLLLFFLLVTLPLPQRSKTQRSNVCFPLNWFRPCERLVHGRSPIYFIFINAT